MARSSLVTFDVPQFLFWNAELRHIFLCILLDSKRMNEGNSPASENILKLQLCGDYEDHFTPFSAGLLLGNVRFSILLDEKQSNMAGWYDDPLKPVEGLINILGDSGHHFALEIVIENGDEEAAADFLASYHERMEWAWASRRDVFIVSSVPEDPDQGNIELQSESGHTFTISMEWDEHSTSQRIEELEALLNKSNPSSALERKG